MKKFKIVIIKYFFSMSLITLFLLFSSAKCTSDDEGLSTLEDPVDKNDSDDTNEGETGQDPFTLATRITPAGIQEGDFFGYAV